MVCATYLQWRHPCQPSDVRRCHRPVPCKNNLEARLHLALSAFVSTPAIYCPFIVQSLLTICRVSTILLLSPEALLLAAKLANPACAQPKLMKFLQSGRMPGCLFNAGLYISSSGAANNIVTLSGVTSGTNGLNANGVGILVLGGANTALGSTTVSGDTLVLAGASTLTGNGTTAGTVNNSGAA
jgi:hypothetical protein